MTIISVNCDNCHFMIKIVVFIDWLIYYYIDTTQRDGSYQKSFKLISVAWRWSAPFNCWDRWFEFGDGMDGFLLFLFVV